MLSVISLTDDAENPSDTLFAVLLDFGNAFFEKADLIEGGGHDADRCYGRRLLAGSNDSLVFATVVVV